MNKAEVRHAKAMANKINGYVAHMRMKMRNLIDATDEDYKDVPVENAEEVFNNLERDWNEIQSVIRDMLGDLRNPDYADEPVEEEIDICPDCGESAHFGPC